MAMIENPKPSRIFRLADLGNKDDRKTAFLGWGMTNAVAEIRSP